MMTQFLPAATSYCRVPNKFNSFSAVRSATARRSCGFSFAALWASWLAPLAGRHILSASDRRLIHDPGFFARQRHGLARTHQHFDLPRLATICSGVNVSFGIFLSVSPCLYSTGTEICGQAIKHAGETGICAKLLSQGAECPKRSLHSLVMVVHEKPCACRVTGRQECRLPRVFGLDTDDARLSRSKLLSGASSSRGPICAIGEETSL